MGDLDLILLLGLCVSVFPALIAGGTFYLMSIWDTFIKTLVTVAVFIPHSQQLATCLFLCPNRAIFVPVTLRYTLKSDI